MYRNVSAGSDHYILGSHFVSPRGRLKCGYSLDVCPYLFPSDGGSLFPSSQTLSCTRLYFIPLTTLSRSLQFSDVLVYTSRTTSPVPQFKVHGQLPLRGVSVEQTDSQLGIANCFTIFGGNR